MENDYLVLISMDGYKSLTTSATTKPKLDYFEYKKKIESLMYAMTSTIPDIAFTIGNLSQLSYNSY